MVLRSAGICSEGCMQAIWTCSHPFKHAITLAVGAAAPAPERAPIYMMQAFRNTRAAVIRFMSVSILRARKGRHSAAARTYAFLLDGEHGTD
jgi:hypothetical protein